MSYISNYTGAEMDSNLEKGGNSIQKIEDSVEVTVGPNDADYTTINDAIKYLSEHRPVYGSSELKAKIILQQDFVMEEQVLVNDTDLGWITIEADEGESLSISDFNEGSAVSGSELSNISEVTIEDYSGDSDNLDGHYILLNTPNDGSYYFYLTTTSGENDPDISDATGVEVEIESLTDDAQDVASYLVSAIDGETPFSANLTGLDNRTVQIENADAGSVDETTVSGSELSVETTQEGRDEQSTTVIVFSSSHDFSSGDRFIIRDQVGGEEEFNYNGTWFVHEVVDSTSIVIDYEEDEDAFWDPVRAGKEGSQSGGDKGEASSSLNIMVSRESLTETWEFFYKPAFGVARGVLPTIGALFQMDDSSNDSQGYFSYLDGLCATDGGVINILPDFGFINADATNIYGTRRSVLNANGVYASGAGRHGIWAYSSSIINARGATVEGCGWRSSTDSTVGPYDETPIEDDQPEEFSSPGFDTLGEYGESIGSGIIATRNSIINAEGCSVSDCHGPNILSEYGSLIAVGGHTGDGTSTGSLLGEDYNFYTRGGGIITFVDDIEIDGLGTAAKEDVTPSSLTGDISGMLMKVGDFGLGSLDYNMSGGDLNSLSPQRTRFFSHSEEGAPSNIPTSAQKGVGLSIHGDQEGFVTFQMWSAVDENRTFVRRQDSSGNWTDWHELWTEYNAPSDDSWNTIDEFLNDWAFEGSDNENKYIKRLGNVTLNMRLDPGNSTDDIVYQLPEDYRPGGVIYTSATGEDSEGETIILSVSINTDGEVAVENTSTDFNEIRFSASFPVV